MRVLITGFGPFPGAPFNPSAALAKALARRRRPALAGIARQPCVRTRRAGEAREWRIARERRRAAKFYDAIAWPMPAGIGKQLRDGVARLHLDAELAPTPGHAEHQHDVGLLFLCEQFWQIAID